MSWVQCTFAKNGVLSTPAPLLILHIYDIPTIRLTIMVLVGHSSDRRRLVIGVNIYCFYDS
jgi:hypothetical protein